MAGLYDKQAETCALYRPKYPAETYALYRPKYPAELFTFLASLTPHSHLKAWDVGTGSGQAAATLAQHYKTVIATDLSEQQLKHAAKLPNITYAVASENMAFEDLSAIVGPEDSVDLITVAQALHWFNRDQFFSHVKRFLRKPGGVIAVWCCAALPYVSSEVDDVTKAFSKKVDPYFEPPKKFVDDEYRTIDFPFDPVVDSALGVGPFEFKWKKDMILEELILYFRSWSPVQTALDKGVVLLDDEVKSQFEKAWGNPVVVRTVTFPIFLLVGCVASPE